MMFKKNKNENLFFYFKIIFIKIQITNSTILNYRFNILLGTDNQMIISIFDKK